MNASLYFDDEMRENFFKGYPIIEVIILPENDLFLICADLGVDYYG